MPRQVEVVINAEVVDFPPALFQVAITAAIRRWSGKLVICCTHLELEPCTRCWAIKVDRRCQEALTRYAQEELARIAAEEDRQWQ